MAGEKYKMFKQFMYNELGITKEDIKDWIKEAVREEARKLIEKTYDSFDVKQEIRSMVQSPFNRIREDITRAAAKQLLKDVHIELVINKEVTCVPLKREEDECK